MRPDHPLLPNYRWIPIGYHGRGSSIVVSGTEIRRPKGQTSPPSEGKPPLFQPSTMLDYELEVAIWIAEGNRQGEPIAIEDAERHWFGLGLLNDWSARDLQRWEYQPLGPFLAKSFATSISPWVVTREALAPFRCPALVRSEGDPQPLAYLDSKEDRAKGGVDLTLEVYLRSHSMRAAGTPPVRLSQGSFRDLYWTIAQLITHHASNGCNLQPGDVLGSGTVSGRPRESRGCLLELTWDGEFGHPVPGTQRTAMELPGKEQRVFLADGDEVILRGYCEAPGFRKIGFGECSGTIMPA
jgi:fumarylacetoacetase